MEYVITQKMEILHTNPEYRYLLVDLLKDPTLHYQIRNGRLVKTDWIPRTEKAMRFAQRMWDWKPTEFADILRTTVILEDFEREIGLRLASMRRSLNE